MSIETIRDRVNNILAYIETDAGGTQTIRDRNNNILGYYKPDSNITLDRTNNIVSYGNTLTRFIPPMKKEPAPAPIPGEYTGLQKAAIFFGYMIGPLGPIVKIFIDAKNKVTTHLTRTKNVEQDN